MSTLEMVLWGFFAILCISVLILALFCFWSGKAKCSEQDDLYARLDAEEFERRVAAGHQPSEATR